MQHLYFLVSCGLFLFAEVENLSSFSTVDGAAEIAKKEEEQEKPLSADSGGNIPSLEDIETKYSDIAKYKIFQLAGTKSSRYFNITPSLLTSPK